MSRLTRVMPAWRKLGSSARDGKREHMPLELLLINSLLRQRWQLYDRYPAPSPQNPIFCFITAEQGNISSNPAAAPTQVHSWFTTVSEDEEIALLFFPTSHWFQLCIPKIVPKLKENYSSLESENVREYYEVRVSTSFTNITWKCILYLWKSISEKLLVLTALTTYDRTLSIMFLVSFSRGLTADAKRHVTAQMSPSQSDHDGCGCIFRLVAVTGEQGSYSPYCPFHQMKLQRHGETLKPGWQCPGGSE